MCIRDSIMIYPNAGLPNELGAYDEAPVTTAGLVGEWAVSYTHLTLPTKA